MPCSGGWRRACGWRGSRALTLLASMRTASSGARPTCSRSCRPGKRWPGPATSSIWFTACSRRHGSPRRTSRISDLLLADNVGRAAKAVGAEQIVYVGGLDPQRARPVTAPAQPARSRADAGGPRRAGDGAARGAGGRPPGLLPAHPLAPGEEAARHAHAQVDGDADSAHRLGGRAGDHRALSGQPRALWPPLRYWRARGPHLPRDDEPGRLGARPQARHGERAPCSPPSCRPPG